MSRPVTAAAAERTLLLLTATRWFPVGLIIGLVTLLMLERGLSVSQVATAIAAQGIVMLALELPTGGLADALGPRLVLVLAGLLTTAGLLLLVVADSTAAFALAWALKGVGRALDSGPLEAWYVEAVRAADPDADVTPGLSRAGAADGAGLCLGAVLGGLLPLLAGGGSSEVLTLPLLVAAVLALVSVVAVTALVVPVGAARTGGTAALRAGLRGVPVVVRATV